MLIISPAKKPIIKNNGLSRNIIPAIKGKVTLARPDKRNDFAILWFNSSLFDKTMHNLEIEYTIPPKKIKKITSRLNISKKELIVVRTSRHESEINIVDNKHVNNIFETFSFFSLSNAFSKVSINKGCKKTTEAEKIANVPKESVP